MNRRTQRLSEEIKREISQIFRSGVKDPRVTSLISVTQVEVSKDLGYAKVYVSLFGNEQEKEQAIEGLDRAKGFVKRELGKKLKLRCTPEITFLLDSSIEYGSHINQLLKKVMSNEETGKENDAD